MELFCLFIKNIKFVVHFKKYTNLNLIILKILIIKKINNSNLYIQKVYITNKHIIIVVKL